MRHLRHVLLAIVLASPAARGQDAVPPGLSPAHAESAKIFMSFAEAMTKDVTSRVAKLNGSDAVEIKTIATDNASYDITVARGPVIEKAGILMVDVTGDMPPRIEDPVFNRFFSIDIHPKTPWVGMVHLAFTLGVDKKGRNNVYGWMDMMPAAAVPEDVEYLRAKVDAYFAKVGRDPAPHREVVCTGEETADRTYRRKPSCAGVSLYPPPTREVTVDNTRFVAGSFETVYRAYFDMIEKRMNQPHGAPELAAQAAMRRNWLEDQLFADPFSSRLVPYAAWSLANAPPSVQY